MSEFKEFMMNEFDMSDLDKMRYFLGIEVVQLDGGICISQTKYAIEAVRRFGMEHSNFVENLMVPGFKISKDENGVEMDGSFFKNLIGSLMYLASTRPDIIYAVSLLSREEGNLELIGFTDSDYVGSIEDRRNTPGYVFMLSGAAVAWYSRKQPIVTLSTMEVEFVAVAGNSC
ncbi:secreted RxLR effector protein 161-like [Lathyrus oleraceus]|uniref:secreted RxLR effector protein 161-like n=1 Tax=Pisum sativum TaxID=3888 RepID=UPI0021D14A73|nr:secreted RxLR effector protein 161-like [Pisum sativum]